MKPRTVRRKLSRVMESSLSEPRKHNESPSPRPYREGNRILTPVRHRMIDILHYRRLTYPPFPKEHARDRVLAAMHTKQA